MKEKGPGRRSFAPTRPPPFGSSLSRSLRRSCGPPLEPRSGCRRTESGTPGLQETMVGGGTGVGVGGVAPRPGRTPRRTQIRIPGTGPPRSESRTNPSGVRTRPGNLLRSRFQLPQLHPGALERTSVFQSGHLSPKLSGLRECGLSRHARRVGDPLGRHHDGPHERLRITCKSEGPWRAVREREQRGIDPYTGGETGARLGRAEACP